jgi:ABC-type branched-subunit amino acid transport system substrate-binding protein
MKRALEDVGHHNLDGSAVKRALESIKDFDVSGMAKVTFGPEDRRGVQEYALCQMQHEKMIGLSDRQQAPVLVPYKR